MPYDEHLAERVFQVLANQSGIEPKKMFGGLAFMLNGNMAMGVEKDRLMVRVGRDRYEDALAKPHCHPLDLTGRPMRGSVIVEPEGIATDPQLEEWVQLGLDFPGSLPAK